MPRLPELTDRNALSGATLRVFDDIIQARGKLADSYAVMLHAPDLVARIVQLATAIRFESSLSRLTLELIALTVCAELDNPYEIAVHTPTSIAAGVSPATLAAIEARAEITGVEDYVSIPIACARELLHTHQLSDQKFTAIQRLFGDRGAVEFLGAVGLYSMLSYMQNGLQVRLPAQRSASA